MNFKELPGSYKNKGLLFGLVAGILISLFCSLFVYACDYGFSPGGLGIPSGACERIGLFYTPFLLLYLFAIFSGPFGLIIPSIITISMCTGVGGLIGWLIDSRHKKRGLSPITKNIIKVSVIMLFISLILSILFVYLDRKNYLADLWMESQLREEFKEKTSFLQPSYLPNGLQKVHIGNEIYSFSTKKPEDVRLRYIYRCEKNQPSRYTLKISAHKSGGYDFPLGPVWRKEKLGYIEEEVRIGNLIGYYFYFNDTNNKIDSKIKLNRGIYWHDSGFYVEIKNKNNAACVYSKDELIKIAESMR